jgi:sugar phosphate isomerase/epimerase
LEKKVARNFNRLTVFMNSLFIANVLIFTCGGFFTAIAQTTPKISVQLWSVKDDVSKDFEKTLTALSAMGFEGVEFAGDYGPFKNDPKGLKHLLDRLGLKASGAHVGLNQLRSEQFAATVDFFKAIACDRLIIPSDPRAGNIEGVKVLAHELTQLAAQLRPYNMRIGFHNHSMEMADYDGRTFWDVLAQATPQEVILQQDVGWTTYAGKDPAYFVKKYPGRTATTHYKSKSSAKLVTQNSVSVLIPLIGQDAINWADLYDANRRFGGTEWIVVEQEEYPHDLSPMQSVEQSLRGLRKVIDAGGASTQIKHNTLTESEKWNNWKLLFDGENANEWHTYGASSVGAAWQVKDGELQLNAADKQGWQTRGGGDLVSKDEYDNFHLKLEWKIAKAGNSGVFFYVNEDATRFPYAWNTGLEMQILDNREHADGKIVKHRAGDLYDLISAQVEAALPSGEWNQVDIVCYQGQLDFFLNGRPLLSTKLWDGAWQERIAQSKFKTMPGFSVFKKGRIGLQDHGDHVSFRNIKVKSL